MKRLLLALFIFLVITSYEPRQMLRAQVMGQAVTFDWVIPTERVDGSPLLNLAGFRLYQSAQSAGYSSVPVVDITNPSINIYVLEGVAEGAWFFVVTAYDANDLESDYSNEVLKTVVIPGITSPPKAPAAFRVVSP